MHDVELNRDNDMSKGTLEKSKGAIAPFVAPFWRDRGGVGQPKGLSRHLLRHFGAIGMRGI